MSAFSDYAESQVGTALLKGGTYTGGAVYIALFTTDPTDAGSGSELVDGNYARQQAHSAVVSDGFTEAPTGTFTNANVIEFPDIASGPKTVTHIGVYDAVSAGNLLMHTALTASKTFETGDIPRFSAGSMTFTFA